ncbi:DUF805 domain-containing protein [Mesonia aestuariivivens]|uniref:DUF805 domain-containing protein n=1 Tax=Mesonia aestuariivivens TaxID=2796128 RepID=A0ABS6VZK0_9FLAO|nr:DUF805 domain-containing protein [Mesonia aestuariivivens]MBW2961028.1 DUF805 domain-containing protein [Mesonia aestuariivivens]
MKWYLKALKQYADFNGRARRKEYFMFSLLNCVFMFISVIIGVALSKLFNTQLFLFIYLVYVLAVLVPSLAVSVRRLHDIGKSGWMLLVNFIPLVGPIWGFVLSITDTEMRDNQYGLNPKYEPFEPQKE